MAKPGLFEGAGPLHCVDDGVKIKLCTCALVFDWTTVDAALLRLITKGKKKSIVYLYLLTRWFECDLKMEKKNRPVVANRNIELFFVIKKS